MLWVQSLTLAIWSARASGSFFFTSSCRSSSRHTKGSRPSRGRPVDRGTSWSMLLNQVPVRRRPLPFSDSSLRPRQIRLRPLQDLRSAPRTTATCSSDTTSGSTASATSVALRQTAVTSAVTSATRARPPEQPQPEVWGNSRCDLPEVIPRRRSLCFISKISTTWLPG